MRKRALANPPPELLCIPQRATTAALRAACTQALRSTYRMLQKFQARTRLERSLGLALHSCMCVSPCCQMRGCQPAAWVA